jgi:hypothetical protein
LEIFKTFDLNPISLNQKFAKPISIFRSQPKSHFGPISMAAQPNSITFSRNWPTCHPAQAARSTSLLAVRPNSARSLSSFLWPKPPPLVSGRYRATLSSRAAAASSPGPAPPFPLHLVPDQCSKTTAPLKPTEPPVTIALLFAPLPPRTYERHRRHAHQSPPLFHALAPLICAHIASPSSFNHRHRSSLVAGKIPSLPRHFLPVVRFAPPPSPFWSHHVKPLWSEPPDHGRGPWWTGRSSCPWDC